MQDLWVPLSGAIAQQRNVETIANNVANANTPGFKKDQLTFKEYLTTFEKGGEEINLPNKEWAPKDFYHSYGTEHGHVKIDGNYTIHRQGRLSPTGGALDLALSGRGFFEILTPAGVRYTRNGVFSLSSDGSLVTNLGHYVLSGKRRPNPQGRTIKLSQGPVSITAEGEIYIRGNKQDQLSIVEFNDLHALRKEGNSLFLNPFPQNIKEGKGRTRVNQGFIEESNVNALSEMSGLIKANRHFESIQKVIKTYDDITGKSINEIARF